jgi:hypothetical protein
MTRKPPEHEYPEYTDTVYSAQLPGTWEPLHKHPANVVTAQASWRENTSARVRKTLEDMLPHDFQIVEGVDVRKYSGSSTAIVYQVNGERSQLTLASAVMRVCEVIKGRQV